MTTKEIKIHVMYFKFQKSASITANTCMKVLMPCRFFNLPNQPVALKLS